MAKPFVTLRDASSKERQWERCPVPFVARCFQASLKSARECSLRVRLVSSTAHSS
jgi:hypothetical protein